MSVRLALRASRRHVLGGAWPAPARGFADSLKSFAEDGAVASSSNAKRDLRQGMEVSCQTCSLPCAVAGVRLARFGGCVGLPGSPSCPSPGVPGGPAAAMARACATS